MVDGKTYIFTLSASASARVKQGDNLLHVHGINPSI